MEALMTRRGMRHALDWARLTLYEHGADVRSDAQLLSDFLASRDERAFAGIMHRHGPMIFGICRRFLPELHDAEDAFQAVFLVFAKRADAIQLPGQLASWLYGVAYKTASKMRSYLGKKRIREQSFPGLSELADAERRKWDDVWIILDHELNRLPAKYRAPIVLCDLEGRSRREAALLLGIPDGTLSGRLSRARQRLAARLSRRGITRSGAALAAALVANEVSATVPADLAATTLELVIEMTAKGAAVSSTGSLGVLSLTRGVIRSMIIAKLGHSAAYVTFSLLIMSAGAGVLAVAGNHSGWASFQAGKGRETSTMGQPGELGGKHEHQMQEGADNSEQALLKAGKAAWEARRKEYVAGREEIDPLLQASADLLASELKVAASSENRLAAFEAHQRRTSKAFELFEQRFQGRKIDEATLDRVIDANEEAVNAALEAESANMVSKPGSRSDDRRMAALHVDLLDAGMQEWQARWLEFKAGRGTQAFLFAASRRLRDAELKNATKPDEMLTARRAHVLRLSRVELLDMQRFAAGKIAVQDLQESRYARIEAELENEQAKRK
jgi:RNA polymerase sigma factor (sigma-70 family)